ncbi:hypothetical protein CEXT_575141, partial [Caerostris extrusa]
ETRSMMILSNRSLDQISVEFGFKDSIEEEESPRRGSGRGCGNLRASPNLGNEFPNSSKGLQLRAGFNFCMAWINGGQKWARVIFRCSDLRLQ